jgi:hypothetical protein
MQALTTGVTGTNSALEQSAIIQNSLSSKWDRLTTRVSNAGAGIAEAAFNLGGLLSAESSQEKILIRLAEEEKKTAEEQRKRNEIISKSITFTQAEVENFRNLVNEGGAVVDVYIKGTAAIKAFQEAQAAQKPIGEQAAETKTTLADLNAQLREFQKAQEGAASRSEWLKFQKQIDSVQRSIDAITGGKSKKNKELEKIHIAHIAVREFGRANSVEAERFNMEWGQAFSAWDKTAAVKKDMMDLAKTAWDVGNAWAAYGGEINKTNDRQAAWLKTQDELDATTKNISTALNTMGSAFASAFEGGEDAMKNALRPILNAIIDFIEAEYLAAAGATFIKAILTGGLSLTSDIAWNAAALVGLEAARAAVNSFAVGAVNIPNDQIARVHSGEMIIPKPFAQSVRSGEISVTGNGSGSGPSREIRRGKRQRIQVSTALTDSPFRSAQRRSYYDMNQGVL